VLGFSYHTISCAKLEDPWNLVKHKMQASSKKAVIEKQQQRRIYHTSVRDASRSRCSNSNVCFDGRQIRIRALVSNRFRDLRYPRCQLINESVHQ
jgi:hypothetical protein